VLALEYLSGSCTSTINSMVKSDSEIKERLQAQGLH